METATPGDTERLAVAGREVAATLWTRADEVRAAVAQELARQGWSASVDLVGATAPQLELVVDSEDPEARRRWTVPVTPAPVPTQVDRLIGTLRGDPAARSRRPETVRDRWCAPP